jgi:predicted peroxiredoxin
MARRLVVKVTCGAEAAERCNQALTVAATALASGAQVSVWLTGEAVWLAVPGRVDLDLPHATPVADLVAVVLTDGSLTVCSQCAKRRDLTEADLLPGTAIAGAASFVALALEDDVQALVY